MTADAYTRRQPWLANWLGICGQQGVCSGCGRADHHRQQPTLDRGAVEAQVCPPSEPGEYSRADPGKEPKGSA